MAAITSFEAQGLFKPDIAEEIFTGAVKYSTAMKLFRRLPNGTTSSKDLPVLSALPLTYWVNERSNNGRKDTTKVAWDKKRIVYEELACIVPIKDNLYKDNKIDWANIIPLIQESMGKKFDQAVFNGADRPAGYRQDILSSIVQAGKLITPNVSETIYSQIDRAMAEVEESDYNVTYIVGGVGMKSTFRGLLDSTGQPLMANEITSIPREYVSNGAWDKTKALLIVGDFSQAVYSIREDIEYKVLTEGVIQAADGSILYNLAQDDMRALRVTFRIGWEIPNPVNAEDSTDARFPFAAIVGTSGVTTQTVTFTVSDGDASSPTYYKDAVINFAGTVGHTNASGVATFKAQAGTYNYTVKLDGYHVVKGTATVASSAVSVSIVPQAK